MFALLSTSVADAVIGVWDAKYEYDLWRPITAIQTDVYPTWQSLIVAPSHPSYISGHSAVGAAAAGSLAFFLGDADACFASFVCFDTFELAALNGANSRLWGGIHWSFDNEQGFLLGSNVADFALSSRFFQGCPSRVRGR